MARTERLLEMIPRAAKKRVLLMVQEFTQGGSERQCATAALGLQERGYEVHAAALRPGGMRSAELAAAGIPLPVFPLRSFASPDLLFSGLRFRRYLLRHRIEIVHTFDVPSNSFAVPWARLARVPRVIASQRAHRDLTPPSLRPFQRWSDRLAHSIVVNCRSVERELIHHHNVPASKIQLIYNGIDTSQFHPEGMRAQLPFPSDTVVVGVICALRPEKDLPVLQSAFAQIAPQFPQAHLLFVGDGPQRKQLEANAIPGRTHFAGSQSSTVPYYRAIDVFVLPSRSEALSNSLLEALACGCRVIASHTGGNPEITDNLFPVGDAGALANLLAEALQSNTPRAAALPAQFTIPRMLDSLEGIYAL
jgi:glycosyltransferase involved in cell wall biosynthesis